jgi:restriction system protein
MLNGMSWRQFEQLVGEAFRLQGYAVKETGGGGADGGVDLRLTRNGETYLVQCKQWRAFKVGVDVVRELYGVMAAEGAAGGFVVTSGRFTDEAVKFAVGRNVTLLDGVRLKGLIQQAKKTQPAAPGKASQATTENPRCPICAKAMVRRTAKRGANLGTEFLGCDGYPECKGTQPIAGNGFVAQLNQPR